MFVKPFRYERASSLEEACELLRQHGDGAKVLAGGQSLLPMLNTGLLDCDLLVDISRIGLDGVAERDGFLEIGALVTHARLAAHPEVRRAQPLVAEAASHIGNLRVRNRGTIGGSLAHADPAAELPLVMTALGAKVIASNGAEMREIAAEELAVSFLSTQLADDEVVAAVRVPVLGEGWGWGFVELARRLGDFAVAAVAVALRTSDGAVLEARVAAGAVSETPVRLGGVEASLSGATFDELRDRCRRIDEVEPPNDSNGSASYRRKVLGVLVRRAVEEAFARAEAA
jgi:CO/xanthine dehydrogenase FAD-binding subunit